LCELGKNCSPIGKSREKELRRGGSRETRKVGKEPERCRIVGRGPLIKVEREKVAKGERTKGNYGGGSCESGESVKRRSHWLVRLHSKGRKESCIVLARFEENEANWKRGGAIH